MYILLQPYRLSRLLANNMGMIAVNNTARTSARLDKTCITNRSRVIPEHSAEHLFVACRRLRRRREGANGVERSVNVPSALHSRVKASEACSVILLTPALRA